MLSKVGALKRSVLYFGCTTWVLAAAPRDIECSENEIRCTVEVIALLNEQGLLKGIVGKTLDPVTSESDSKILTSCSNKRT